MSNYNNIKYVWYIMGKLFFLTNEVLFFNLLRVNTFIIIRRSHYKLTVNNNYVLKKNLFVLKYWLSGTTYYIKMYGLLSFKYIILVWN